MLEDDEYIRIKDETDDELKGEDDDNIKGNRPDDAGNLSDNDKVLGGYQSDDNSEGQLTDSNTE